jgi:hypothetical protein
MQTTLLLTVLLGLGACGFASKPDPRVAIIRQQHQQLLAKQKVAAGAGEEADFARESFSLLAKKSNNIQQAVDQLDPSNSQEAAQVALVTDLASQEATLLEQAKLVERMSYPKSTHSQGETDGDNPARMETVGSDMDTTNWAH